MRPPPRPGRGILPWPRPASDAILQPPKPTGARPGTRGSRAAAARIAAFLAEHLSGLGGCKIASLAGWGQGKDAPTRAWRRSHRSLREHSTSHREAS